MPKYTNSTGVNKQLGSLLVPPRSTVESDVYYTNLPAGVTLSDEAPRYSPVVVSKSFTADATENFPTDIDTFLISLYVEAGTWEIRFNTDAMDPAITLTDGGTWSKKLYARVINDIRFKEIVGGKVWLQIEKL